MFTQVVEDMMRQLMPAKTWDRSNRPRTVDRLRLSTFVESTANVTLDPWQYHMCGRLERLTYEKGQRILLHAPPQFGKSIVVSQRLPAYLIGDNPITRVKSACYNIDHATKFTKVTKNLMLSAQFRALFPSDELMVAPNAPVAEWSTAARLAILDGQASMKALGLLTGFVGEGVDHLIIDDPYASPQDALSPAIRESTWCFWDESARVRCGPDTNVIVMFHRYHQDHLAGRLIAEEGLKEQGGKWELIRYCAEWDGDTSPEYGGPDPLGRTVVGEKLSPRFPEEFYEEQKRKGYIYLAQFQGRPTSKEGLFFKVDNLVYVDPSDVPQMVATVRSWDLAATSGAGNFTRGVKEGVDAQGRFWILDMRGGQWAPDERDRIIQSTAREDGAGCSIHFPQDPGQAGKTQVGDLTRKLAGYNVFFDPVSGDKPTRATPFASQVNNGNVFVVRAPWNPTVREELRLFPLGRNDDIVDAGADGFNFLAQRSPVAFAVGGSRDLDGMPQPASVMILSPENGTGSHVAVNTGVRVGALGAGYARVGGNRILGPGAR